MAFTEALRLLITADSDGAVRALEKVGGTADKELGKTTSSIDKFASKMQIGGAAAVGLAAVALPALGKLGNAAGDLSETINKSNVIFGDASGSVERFGDTAAKSLGLSKTAAIDAAATFGTLFTNIGKSSADAADMSIKLTTLAGDLASFSNTSPEEAVLALGAALRGESEPIRRFGVLLDDATLKQQAMTLGIYDGTGSLTPATRAQAAYAEILKQTTKQQGDFARTSDSLANQQRIAKAEFENLKASIGQGVVPAMTVLLSTTNDVLGAFNRLPSGVQAGVGTFATFTTAGLGAAGSIAVAAGTILKSRDEISKALFKMGEDGERSFTKLGKAATVAAGVFAGLAIVGTIQSIRQSASAELDKLASKFDQGTNAQFVEASRRLNLIGKETEVFDRVLENNVDTAQRWADAIRAAGGDVTDWDVKIGLARRNQAELADDTEQATKSTRDFGLIMDKTGRVVKDSAGFADKSADGFKDIGDEAEDAAPKVLSLKKAQELLDKQMADSRKAMDDLNAELSDYEGFMTRLLGKTNDLRNADMDWNESLSGLLDTVAENGPAWDIWTKAGIANNRALDDTIEKVGVYIGQLGTDYPGSAQQFRTESGKFITELYNQANAMKVPKSRLDEIISNLLTLQAMQEINIKVRATIYSRAELNNIAIADPVLSHEILQQGGSRDSGGPGMAGVSYKIGVEEYFIPASDGGFVPLHNAPTGGWGGGSTTVVMVNVEGSIYADDMERRIKKAVIEGSNRDGGWNIRTRSPS